MNEFTLAPVQKQGENLTSNSRPSLVSDTQSTEGVQATSGDGFTVVVDGIQHQIALQKLEAQALIDLEGACSAAVESVVIDLSHLPRFSQQDRLRVIKFTAIIDRKTIVVGGQEFEDLLEAVLSLLTPGVSTSLLAQVKTAAFEITALLYPASLSKACQDLQERLRAIGQKGIRHGDLMLEAKKVLSQIESLERTSQENNRTLVQDVFPEAPVPTTLRLPPLWSEAEGGLQKNSGRINGRLPSAVFVVAILYDQTGKQGVVLCWQTLGGWQTKGVDRIEIADKARCTALASFGVPVTSNTATLLVQFLSDFMVENESDLPIIKTVSKMGLHQVDDHYVFVWGRKVITAEAIVNANHDCPGSATPASMIMFRGHDEGLDQLAEGYQTRGTFAAWYEQVVQLLQFPKLRFMLISSFAPVILEITGTSNFTLSVAGRTTTGKTSSMKLCASVWGCPNDNNGASLISNWDATSTYRERHRLAQNNLPVFVDETKLAKGCEQEVPRNIYATSTGLSRGRGSITGIARQESSKNIIFMTGEQSATSFSQDGGAFARVIELRGSPFGESSPHTGVIVRESLQVISDNYGHAGPIFVRYVLTNQSSWPQWRERYRQLITQYESKAGDNHIMLRAAAYLAVITLTSELTHAALSLPGTSSDPVEPLWEELYESTAAADQGKRALLLAYDYAVRYKDRFQHGNNYGKYNYYDKISQELIGRWEPSDPGPLAGSFPNVSTDNSSEINWLGFIPSELERLLRTEGYNLDAIVREWSASGCLVTDNDKQTMRNQKTTTINGRKIRVYAISGAAITAAQN